MHLRTFGINERIDYKEVNIDKGIINKIYEINNQGCEDIVTIPDGCIDIEIVYKDDKIYSMICGSHVEGMLSEVGNYDQSHFIKSFKKFTTFTPKKYIDNMKKIMFV